MMVNLTSDKSHPIVTFDVRLTDERGGGVVVGQNILCHLPSRRVKWTVKL